MPVRRPLIAWGALLLLGCAGLPFFRGTDDAASGGEGAKKHAASPAQVVLELQDTAYDGEYLSGRLLVGVADGQVTLDKRLIENVSVQVESVSDCVVGQPVAYVEADFFPKPATEEDLLTLTVGYWYGTRVRFFLFDEKLIGENAPGCIEVALALRAVDRSVAGRLRVRAERKVELLPNDGGPVPLPGCGGGNTDGGCGTMGRDASSVPEKE
jgi:hypothetical protein